MAIVLSGTTNDILVNGVSVATDAEVSSAVASGVAPKANTADLKEIGVGQTWQDVTASRVAGTTYTNSTGKPIMVSIISVPSDSGRNLTIDSIMMSIFQATGADNVARTNTGIVPPGQSYSFGGGTFYKWHELR